MVKLTMTQNCTIFNYFVIIRATYSSGKFNLQSIPFRSGMYLSFNINPNNIVPVVVSQSHFTTTKVK